MHNFHSVLPKETVWFKRWITFIEADLCSYRNQFGAFLFECQTISL